MSIQGRLEVLSDWSHSDRNRPRVQTSHVGVHEIKSLVTENSIQSQFLPSQSFLIHCILLYSEF